MARLPMEMDERPMSVEVDGKTMMMTPSEIADMESMDSTGGEAIPAEQDMGLNSMSGMPMMSDEEKRLFMDLFEKGIPEEMIIDIMASAKVGQAVEGAATASLINPAEFGGLPNTGSSPAGNPSMPTAGGTGGGAMTNQDMAMYLQNKVNEIKSRTGGNTGMGALSGVPAGNQTPMAMPTPRPAMPQRLGADRTFNPMDQLTPTNAPNT